jgi:hypothetical protein
VSARHIEELQFGRFRQKLRVTAEPFLLVWQFEMTIEIGARSPVFLEVEDVWISRADMKMIVNAARPRAPPIDKPFEERYEFCPLLVRIPMMPPGYSNPHPRIVLI